MQTFKQLRDKLEISDRNIQSALRETDAGELADAMIGMNAEEQEWVYRNMTKRATALLKQDVEEREKRRPPESVTERSLEIFLRRINKYAKYELSSPLPEVTDPPKVDISSEDAIIRTFVEIRTYIGRHSYLDLEGIEEQTDNPVMRKGLQMIVDGWDPLTMQNILERYKATYLQRVERQVDMMLAGFEALSVKDPALVIEEKMRPYMP